MNINRRQFLSVSLGATLLPYVGFVPAPVGELLLEIVVNENQVETFVLGDNPSGETIHFEAYEACLITDVRVASRYADGTRQRIPLNLNHPPPIALGMGDVFSVENIHV